jgi:N6-adenosine-specific RNA methylase IME4
MKHNQAIRLAIQAMQHECSRLAVNANLHERMGLDTPACIAASQKRKQLEEAIALLQPQPKPLSFGEYTIIYADPPWKYNNRANHKTRFRGGAQGHYPCMPFEEIAELPIGSLGAKNSILLMWCTFPFLDDQIRLFEHWGYSYRTQMITWTKLNPRGWDLPKDDPNYLPGKPYVLYTDGLFHSVFFGTGHYAKANPEVLLLGMRGQVPIISDKYSSVVLAPLSEHSRKPDEAYSIIEGVFGQEKRIELFARRSAPGWTTLGNGIDGRDIKEALHDYASIEQ